MRRREQERRAPALLPSYDRDARYVPTIVMRREGGVLQRYGHQGLLRCVTTVLAGITWRTHCVGRDQTVGRLSTISMKAKEGVSLAEESFQLGVETHRSTTIMPAFYSNTTPKVKEQSQNLVSTD